MKDLVDILKHVPNWAIIPLVMGGSFLVIVGELMLMWDFKP